MIVKVCGMREAENIRQVEQTGADWMGFIDYEGSPRYVPGVPEYLPETVQKVGVFVNASLSQIRERVATWQLDYVQLHGKESPEFAGKCNRLAYVSSRPSPCVRLMTYWLRKAMPPSATIFCSTLPATDTELRQKLRLGMLTHYTARRLSC